jgi:hypothetical protein
MIGDTMQRTIVRWVDLILAIPIIGYVYSPFEEIPSYAPLLRYGFMPAIMLAGLCFWKGQLARRMPARRAT